MRWTVFLLMLLHLGCSGDGQGPPLAAPDAQAGGAADAAPQPADDAAGREDAAVVAAPDASAMDAVVAAPDAASMAPPDAATPSTTPLIGDVIGCSALGSAGGLANGSDLQRYDFDLARFPDALCNDGTPATLYFRPHNGAANRDRWVIQLMGGGGCRSADDCARRWCSMGTNFGTTQMSSRPAPRGTVANGLFERRADNPVGDWNHVLVRYCSSDAWSGTRRDVVVTGADPSDGVMRTWRMHFLGGAIFDATIAALRGEGGPLMQGAAALPDLDDAQTILLAGASAGGGGVINNVDRLRAQHPRADVRALIDSSLGPRIDGLDASTTVMCTTRGLCSWEALMRDQVTNGAGPLWGHRGDTSCIDWHRQNMPGTEWQCIDGDHVAVNHLTTPMFARMGQRDELSSGNAIEAGWVVPGRGPIDLPLFAEIIRSQMAALADIQTTAHEGSAISVVPGVFSPTCDKHETLRSTRDTFDVVIRLGGADHRMFDVFSRWFTGGSPISVITPPGTRDVCP